MEALDAIYKTQLDNIKATIQNSELLASYLEEEEEEAYKALVAHFEPQIQEVYMKVADTLPLQLKSLEKELLDPGFEGLYLPKVLGYSVLRGEVNEHVKYRRPQNHFKEILEAITQSSNFDLIANRTGQSVKIGFALSSDIWVTNLLDSVVNKKVKYFLQSQRSEEYRSQKIRNTGLFKYRRQFHSLNYQSTEFATTKTDLVTFAPSIKNFLLYRSANGYDNESLVPHIEKMITTSEFLEMDEFLDIMMIVGLYIPLNDKVAKKYTETFNIIRKEPRQSERFFKVLNDLQESAHQVTKDNDERLSKLIDRNVSDGISAHYGLLDAVHGKGYIHEDVIEAVRTYYDQNEGRSKENECLRASILTYFRNFLGNLPETDYQEYFEINKVFTQYMGIFSNQKFNQDVKLLSLRYVKKLLKKFTDKRGKDYQDIKKWVRTTFSDLGFLKDKELVELFKTRRKKKVAS